MAKASASDVKAGGAHVEIGGETSKLDGVLSMAKDKLKAFGGNVTKLGKSFSKLGAVMAVPLAGGIKMAADFGEQMASVSTMVDQSDVGKFMPGFSADIRRMSVEFGEGTDTIAKGLYDILSASIAPAKAIDVLRASMMAAKAGMTDTGTAADAITTILNSYKLSADKAGSVSDLLFATVKRGKTTFAELAPAVGMVAATASVAGLSMEEMAATLATGTRNGVRTRISVTALNSTLMAFLKPTEKAAKAAKQFGFELNTNTLRTIGLTGVIKKMQGATAEQIASVFENRRSLKLIMPVIQDLEGFTIDLALAQKRGGLTQEAYAKMTIIMMHTIRKLKQSVVDLLRAIGISLENRTKAWMEAVIGLVAAIKLWIKQNPQLLASYATLAVKLLALGASLMVIGKGITFVAGLLSPGGLFAVGMGSILYFSGLLDSNTKKWLDWVGKVELGSTTVGAVFEGIKKLWVDLAPAWRSGLTAAGASWDWFLAGMKVGWLRMSQFLLRSLGEFLNDMAKLLISEAEGINVFKPGGQMQKDWVLGMSVIMSKISTSASETGSKIIKGIKPAIDELTNATKKLDDAWANVGGIVGEAKGMVKDFVKETIKAATTAPSGEGGQISDYGKSLLKNLEPMRVQLAGEWVEISGEASFLENLKMFEERAKLKAQKEAIEQGKSLLESREDVAIAVHDIRQSLWGSLEEALDKSSRITETKIAAFAPPADKAIGPAATGIVGTFAGATASLLAGGPRRVLEDQLDTMKKILNASERTADNTAERGLA